MWLPSLAPPLLRDCGLDPLHPSAEGLTEQWLGVSCTQEHSWDRAAAYAHRLWQGPSLPQKKFTQSCGSSVSGIMENHNTDLGPGFTLNDLVPAPANVVVLWSLLGPLGSAGTGWHTASIKCLSSSGTPSPYVA